MKYRKYMPIIGAVVITVALSACATSATKADRTVAENPNSYNGREPASMQGDFSWLNQVEDDFGRIADETSTRAVASQNKQETLLKQKDWSFSYAPKTNHFYVELQGSSYKMVQTRINDTDRFGFAAEGQAENPLTLAVATGEGRHVASGNECDTELSYWNKAKKAYVTDKQTVKGKACERMLELLKDYVP